MQHQLHSSTASARRTRPKLKPLWISGRVHAPKRHNICDSYTLLQLPGQPKRPQMKHVPRQRGLWTPTPGVSTTIFRDNLQRIHTKKRNGGHVDSFLPYNIKSDHCPQTSGGPQSPKQNQVSKPDPASAAATLGGALSLSTRAGS